MHFIRQPFVPDFWESSKNKDPEPIQEVTTPKLVLASGESTYHGGGPSLNLYQYPVEPSESGSSQALKSSGTGGIFADMVDDLGLSGFRFLPKADLKLQAEMVDSLTYHATTPAQKEFSRSLDEDERKGLWVLLGIIGGGWLLGGLFGPKKRSAKIEH